MRKRSASEINCIVVHHSGTDQGNVQIFRDYHTNVNGWSDVGYHYVICNGKGGKDGEVQPGRDLMFSGAHCIPRNLDSIGICLVGNFQNTHPTEAQLSSLKKLCLELCQKYTIPHAYVFGHRECDEGTECPGDKFNVQELRDYLRSALAQSMLGKVVDDSAAVYLNGTRLDKDAVIIEGTSYLPARLLAETLGFKVAWEPSRIDLSTG
jgi:N-acetyl-anhydromuramyl-L-alanine amidase AmpD